MAKYSYAQSAKQRSAFVKSTKSTKASLQKGFLGCMPNFFPLSNLKKKILLRVELSDYCVPGKKKAKNGSTGALHATWRIPLHASTNNQRPRGHTGNWNSKYIYSIEPVTINISLKLHLKLIKVLIKRKIRGTNFWDTLTCRAKKNTSSHYNISDGSIN